jgi:hypothetical protein
MIKDGRLAREDAERLAADIVNRALDAGGITDYVSSRPVAPLKEFWAKA